MRASYGTVLVLCDTGAPVSASRRAVCELSSLLVPVDTRTIIGTGVPVPATARVITPAR